MIDKDNLKKSSFTLAPSSEPTLSGCSVVINAAMRSLCSALTCEARLRRSIWPAVFVALPLRNHFHVRAAFDRSRNKHAP